MHMGLTTSGTLKHIWLSHGASDVEMAYENLKRYTSPGTE